MFFYYIVLLAFTAGMVTAFTTQLFVPLIKGTKIFPALRTTRQDVVDQYVQTQEDLEVAKMQLEIADLSKQLAEAHREMKSGLAAGLDPALSELINQEVKETF